MQTFPLTKVSIVTEALLKDRIIAEIRAAGAKGYTMIECSGEGSRQRRVSEILGDNIKFEVITTQANAERLLQILQHDYFPQYAVIAYLTQVNVVRGDKYV
jgi:nitrogen regulatory protein P-II 2